VLGVFLAGLFLGPVWGVAAMVLYPVAAFAVGYVAHGGLELSDPSRAGVGRLVGSMVLGTAIIYGIGVAGLMLVLGLGPVEAFLAGAASFVPAEAFKVAAAVGIVRSDAVVAD
jgi:biotin transport system substrate-specific component